MTSSADPVDPLVVFTPSGKRGRFPHGTTVLQAARRLGVDLDSVCGGRGICGRCQVDVAEGLFPKHGLSSAADHLTPAGPAEARYADKRGALPLGRRLGCQALVRGDLVIDVPPESQLHRQVVRKRAEAHPMRVDPLIHLHCVAVREPDMADPSSDFGRLCEALRAEGVAKPRAGIAVLRDLQPRLRAGGWQVTVAVEGDGVIVRLWPGLHTERLGLAVDIGSTTIAAHLCDLASGAVIGSAGLMNGQIRFGEDLMSRVSYAMLNPNGTAELTGAVRDGLRDLVRAVAGGAGIDPGDILAVTVVGNPVMHHLLLGLDPSELGGAPFALAVDAALDVPARELGLAVAPGASVHMLPCIAGHVGADAAAMVLSEGPHLSDEIRLLVDVGTNAEIVLGNRSRLLAASSPTGPAFEGAQISCGQRAAPGAIERIRIDPVTLEPRYKVIGTDLWSDEPGFAEAVALTGVTGLCGSGIIELVAELFLAGAIASDGTLLAAGAERSPRIEPAGRTFSYLVRDGEPRLVLHQTDIRAIQLAKAALYAGIKLLLRRFGTGSLDRVTLAGAFGTVIDPRYAMVLGMIPDCRLDRVGSVGNAAGTGARMALISGEARHEIGEVVRRIEKIETAIEPRFQEDFVAAMAFPHATDAFPHLAEAVRLPEPSRREESVNLRRRRVAPPMQQK